MATGIVRDDSYLNHDMGPYHVESPARLKAIYEMLDAEPSFASLVELTPRPADEKEIALVHHPAYINQIKATQGKNRVILDPDTSTCAFSYETARLAAGGVIEAVRQVMETKVANAFALIRPPGHHAEAGRAMGFCFFNNVAIAARWLIKEYGLKRILIVDWDLHHGNGTQQAFWKEKEVLYFSTHQFPYYPGTGYWDEVGRGEGEGYTFNVPLSAGKGDREFQFIFQEILAPLAFRYRPEFILVSAGFDIYTADPLGGMMVTPEGLAGLASQVISLARETAGGKLVLALEGGYSLEGLRSGVREILFQLTGLRPSPQIETAVSVSFRQELAPAFENLRRYWA
ncbi:MAG: histone deacetylase family protein [Candidatus Aminicenantales bacterium]